MCDKNVPPTWNVTWRKAPLLNLRKICKKAQVSWGLSKLLTALCPAWEPCDAKWTLVYHLTVYPQGAGQAALICLTSVKKKNLNWLYKLYGFFSTGRFKCQCVLCLPWAFPGERSPLKGFWRRIKAFSSTGGRNTIVMLSSLHTPTNGVLSIRPQHWGG